MATADAGTDAKDLAPAVSVQANPRVVQSVASSTGSTMATFSSLSLSLLIFAVSGPASVTISRLLDTTIPTKAAGDVKNASWMEFTRVPSQMDTCIVVKVALLSKASRGNSCWRHAIVDKLFGILCQLHTAKVPWMAWHDEGQSSGVPKDKTCYAIC